MSALNGNGHHHPDGVRDGHPDHHETLRHNHLRRRWLRERQHGLPPTEHPLSRFARVWADTPQGGTA